jgi:uncharacterized membrane protein
MADENKSSGTPSVPDTFAPPHVMERVDLIISRLLRGGVIASMATVLLGAVLMFVHHPQYLRSAADLQRLTTAGAAFPQSLADVARGVLAGRGQAVVVLGLILLIATPIMRVVVAIVGFALQGDRALAVISAVVLLVLLISFLLGKSG